MVIKWQDCKWFSSDNLHITAVELVSWHWRRWVLAPDSLRPSPPRLHLSVPPELRLSQGVDRWPWPREEALPVGGGTGWSRPGPPLTGSVLSLSNPSSPAFGTQAGFWIPWQKDGGIAWVSSGNESWSQELTAAKKTNKYIDIQYILAAF